MRYGPTEINKSPTPARLALPSEYLLLIINEAKMELQLGEPHYLSGLQTNKFIDERRQSEREAGAFRMHFNNEQQEATKEFSDSILATRSLFTNSMKQG